MPSVLDDYGNPLELSASPGLAPLQGEAPTPSVGLADQMAPAAPSPDLPGMAASPALDASTSPGFAPAYKAARSSDDQEYLKNMPLAQKIGLVLQSYQAGVEGRPNPFQTALDQKTKREAEFRAELGTTIQTIKGGVDLVKSMPPGKAREALIEQLTRAAGPSGGIVKDALMSAGTDNEKALTDIVSVIENPQAQAMLVATASKAADPRKEALRLISDSDFMKRLEQRADQSTLPSVTAKLAVVTRAMAKDPQFAGTDGNASFTMAQLREQNAKLPKELQLSDAELGTANRNQSALITYGLKTDKTQQDEQSAIAKRKEEGPHSEIAKLNTDLNNGAITKPQWTAGVRKALMTNEKQDAKVATQTENTAILTPEAIEDAAHRYLLDGTLPPNAGRGTQGAGNNTKILNRAADLSRANGDTAEEARIRQLANKASSGALTQITKQEQMVGAFEKNASRNADIALNLSKEVDRTGVPVVNRWIMAGMKEVAGDPKVAQFHAATETFINEYSKIMSGSMGNTAVTDSMRKEVHTMLSTAATPEQYAAVVSTLKQEMGNRMKGFAEQKAQLTDSMRAPKKDATAAPASNTTSPQAAGGVVKITSDAEYDALPSGTKFVGPDGKQRQKP